MVNFSVKYNPALCHDSHITVTKRHVIGKNGHLLVMLHCFCNDRQLISKLFNNLMAKLVQSYIENTLKVNYRYS
jgi:hypothetical protein